MYGRLFYDGASETARGREPINGAAEAQHERIVLAARELAEVSARLQAAAAALHESL